MTALGAGRRTAPGDPRTAMRGHDAVLGIHGIGPPTPARHFADYDRAARFARHEAARTGQRQFLCHRLGCRWYVLDPARATAARGNANWPGVASAPARGGGS